MFSLRIVDTHSMAKAAGNMAAMAAPEGFEPPAIELEVRRSSTELRGRMQRLETRAGIEPAYADLQSAASPLCHRVIWSRMSGLNRRPELYKNPALPLS
jgi:hypothetical protein